MDTCTACLEDGYYDHRQYKSCNRLKCMAIYCIECIKYGAKLGTINDNVGKYIYCSVHCITELIQEDDDITLYDILHRIRDEEHIIYVQFQERILTRCIIPKIKNVLNSVVLIKDVNELVCEYIVDYKNDEFIRL